MPTKANAINESTTGVSGFTGTAFTGTPVTQHNVLIGGSTSSTITNVSPSTAGFVLTSNGASADPSFQAATGGGGGGSLTFIQSKTASSATSLAFTTGITTGFSNYLLIYESVEATLTGSAFYLAMQLSTNGGSSYINTGYQNAGASGITSSLLIAQYLTSNSGGTGVISGNGYLNDFTRGTAADFPSLTASFMTWDGATGVSGVAGSATYTVASTTVNAFQLLLTNGGTFSGKFTLYGYSATGGGSGGLLTTTTTLSSSQIKALVGTPITVLSAPGANNIIVVRQVDTFFSYGGNNAFVAGSVPSIVLWYNTNTNGNQAYSIVCGPATYSQTSNAYLFTEAAGQAAALSSSGMINQPIVVGLDSTSTNISGNAANDNEIIFVTTYQIINVTTYF